MSVNYRSKALLLLGILSSFAGCAAIYRVITIKLNFELGGIIALILGLLGLLLGKTMRLDSTHLATRLALTLMIIGMLAVALSLVCSFAKLSQEGSMATTIVILVGLFLVVYFAMSYLINLWQRDPVRKIWILISVIILTYFLSVPIRHLLFERCWDHWYNSPYNKMSGLYVAKQLGQCEGKALLDDFAGQIAEDVLGM